jgi:hypothetical protein
MLSQNHLTLNVLNFSFVSEKLCCYITTRAIEGAVKLSQKDTKFFVHHLKLPTETAELYTPFVCFFNRSTPFSMLYLSFLLYFGNSQRSIWYLLCAFH